MTACGGCNVERTASLPRRLDSRRCKLTVRSTRRGEPDFQAGSSFGSVAGGYGSSVLGYDSFGYG